MFGLSIDLRRALGKTKTRSQMCLVGSEDGRIVNMEVAVLKGCAADDAKCSAWLLDSSNLMRDEATGYWYQVLGERSTIPVCLITESKVKDLGKLINDIFHESWVLDLVQLGRDAAEEKQRTWLYVILGIPIILGALILGINVIR